MSQQEQFLNVIDRDEAETRFRSALSLKPLALEWVELVDAWGRVLATDVLARIDVPSFDRSNFDGFALRACETFGATESAPTSVRLLVGALDAGLRPDLEIQPGEGIGISTGGMIPRGADAILMVEHSEVGDGRILIRRAVSPGTGVSFAGTDIATGEIVLRASTVLTSRETGVLAALGESRIPVWRRPRVAIISTGNEIIAPGEPMRPACVYDSNSQILRDAVRELGGLPRCWGIVRDNVEELRETLTNALADSDVVLLSGGTSKGQGDLCYRVVAELVNPGIVVHGVALKPGKPLCLAATNGKPVVILPGFPTSAIFTFHEFVAPILRIFEGRPPQSNETVCATMAVKTNSEVGRTEYLLVGLVKNEQGLNAFPMGKGSGSVTTFSRADGFVTIPRYTEIVESGQPVNVHLIGCGLEPADLIIMGSHCVGLDNILSQLQRQGVTSKFLAVGSSAGLESVKRGECDLAGIHLLDPLTGKYNLPFLSSSLVLIDGYRRSQGIVYRPGDRRFENRTVEQILVMLAGRSQDAAVHGLPATNDLGSRSLAAEEPLMPCVMVNRNAGSGTRILIDRLLSGVRPNGYAVQPSNHRAVAAAITQGRADWGLAIESVARSNHLGFLPCQEEYYDFVVPKARYDRPAIQAFLAMLNAEETRQRLLNFGFQLTVRKPSQ